jgi:hypothetical protein
MPAMADRTDREIPTWLFHLSDVLLQPRRLPFNALNAVRSNAGGETMQQILVGRFRDPKDAEVAMSLLVADGIPLGDIKFKSHGAAPAPFFSEDTASNGLLHGLGNFFDRLFGAAGDSEARDYAEPVPPGGAVIVVTVHPGEKSQRAHAALADMGATEIERR